MQTLPGSHDRFEAFHHFLDKLEFLLFRLALLAVFVIWLWDKVHHEVQPSAPPTPSEINRETPSKYPHDKGRDISIYRLT